MGCERSTHSAILFGMEVEMGMEMVSSMCGGRGGGEGVSGCGGGSGGVDGGNSYGGGGGGCGDGE